MKQFLRIGAGVAVAGLLLWLFFRGIDPRAIRTALAESRPQWLLVSLFFTLFHYFVRAARWRLLLRPLRRGVAWRPLLDAIIAGYAVTFLIPGRLGEIYRPAHLARHTRLRFASVLTTVGLDRVLDVLTLVVLLVAFLLWAPASGPGALPAEHAGSLRQAGYAAGSVLLLVLPLLWLVARYRQRVPLPSPGAPGVRGLLGRHLGALLEGLAVLQAPTALLSAVAWSLVIWLVLAGQAWGVLRAFSIDLPFTAAFALVAFLALGIAVPAPAGVGGFHYLGKFCLVEVFAVVPEQAVTAILVLHLMSILPAILLGGWLLVREGASLGEVLQGGATPEAGGPAGEEEKA